MGYFQDTRVCQEHGFVLTPEGACVRCASEGERAAKRRTLAKAGTAVTVVAAALMGITVARARVSTVDPTAIVSPPAAVAATPVPAAPPPPGAAPEPTPRPSVDWDQAMARAEEQRVNAATAQVAAEKQREIAATALPDPPVESYAAPRQEPAAEPVDPAFAQSYGRPRTYYRAGTRGGAAGGSVNSPSAWGLPANNGGYFRNRNGGH